MNALEVVALVALVLWLLGAFAFPVAGQVVHILLVIFVVLVIIRWVQGRTTL